jgi:hypothetical protein
VQLELILIIHDYFSQNRFGELLKLFGSGTETLERLGSVVRLIHPSQSSWRDHSDLSLGFIVEEGRCIICQVVGIFRVCGCLVFI